MTDRMDFLVKLVHALFPPNQERLNAFIQQDVGPGMFYAVVFAIIFCETGLVLTPFLPGDSLLFVLGAIGAGSEPAFNLPAMAILLVIAALLGDNLNYWIGRRVGPAVFSRDNSRLLNRKHLAKAQGFYETYGTKTVILARFVPIVRTFAPFVAGIGRMSYVRFLTFSVVGALLWVGLCISAGYFFGNNVFVKKHFELVVIAIVVISVLPMAIEVLRARSRPAGFDPTMRDDGRH